jgi:hypothetical protein
MRKPGPEKGILGGKAFPNFWLMPFSASIHFPDLVILIL